MRYKVLMCMALELKLYSLPQLNNKIHIAATKILLLLLLLLLLLKIDLPEEVIDFGICVAEPAWPGSWLGGGSTLNPSFRLVFS